MRYFFITFLVLIVISGSISLTSGEIDLREANVTNVSVTKLDGLNYNFAVTLYHDDQGEDGYADSWQVEKLDGTILGTRILTHAHGTLEFTREKIIAIPETVKTVVVRGHDQTHGLGGQVVILELTLGNIEFVDQGSDPMDFSNYKSTSTSTTSTISIQTNIDENTVSDTLTFTSFISVGMLLLLGGLSLRRIRK